MNKRDRVGIALGGGTPDRIPAAFWFHFVGEKAAGQPAIDAHIDYFKQCGCDMMKIMSDSYFDYAASMEIKKPSDWYKLEPLGTSHPFYAGQIERAAAIMFIGRELPAALRGEYREVGLREGVGAAVGRGPVSYTHLDVYKRQQENRRFFSWLRFVRLSN